MRSHCISDLHSGHFTPDKTGHQRPFNYLKAPDTKASEFAWQGRPCTLHGQLLLVYLDTGHHLAGHKLTLTGVGLLQG